MVENAVAMLRNSGMARSSICTGLRSRPRRSARAASLPKGASSDLAVRIAISAISIAAPASVR